MTDIRFTKRHFNFEPPQYFRVSAASWGFLGRNQGTAVGQEKLTCLVSCLPWLNIVIGKCWCVWWCRETYYLQYFVVFLIRGRLLRRFHHGPHCDAINSHFNPDASPISLVFQYVRQRGKFWRIVCDVGPTTCCLITGCCLPLSFLVVYSSDDDGSSFNKGTLPCLSFFDHVYKLVCDSDLFVPWEWILTNFMLYAVLP